MGSDSKVEYRGINNSHGSSRAIVLEELHRLKEKLNSTPFPFCELTCPWLTICLDISTSECILSLLLNVNSENPKELGEEGFIRIQWN
ncbi:MAG: hypothetical protein KAT16_10185 [Candidatus Heimdallarchaeota archaeon]|nr:hypothetical protein [Candidatus Heimdallarchaeota archaeon]